MERAEATCMQNALEREDGYNQNEHDDSDRDVNLKILSTIHIS